MKSVASVLILLLFAGVTSQGQSIDSLKLTGKEIPGGYTLSEENYCISVQPRTLYNNPELFEALLGKVKRKDIQNFKSRDDRGCIMYFEFDDEFKGEGFLGAYLWGEDKPSKMHPETYAAKKNILVIWSFNSGSEIKKVSEDKVKTLLK